MAKPVLTLDEAVEKILELALQTPTPRPLPFYWDVGKLLNRVPDQYGSSKRIHIANKLDAAGIEGLQKENLFKATKLSVTLDRATTIRLEGAGVGWRAAAQLCSSHVDKVRGVLIDAVLEGKVEPDKFGGMIRKMAGQKALTNNRSILTAAARATKDIKLLIRIAHRPRVEDDLTETAKSLLHELRELLDERLA